MLRALLVAKSPSGHRAYLARKTGEVREPQVHGAVQGMGALQEVIVRRLFQRREKWVMWRTHQLSPPHTRPQSRVMLMLEEKVYLADHG